MAKTDKKKKAKKKIGELYEKKGESLSRKNQHCPKCGEGFFMAKHKDRITCGQCHYAEFISEKKK